MAELQKLPSDIETAELAKQGELVLNYKPYAGMEKWVKYRFSAFSSAKAWFAMALVVLFFGFGGPGMLMMMIINLLSGTMPTVAATLGALGMASTAGILVPILLLTAFSIALPLSILYLRHPTHLSLSSNGVCFEWHRWRFDHGVMLSWKNIERIEMYWPPGKTSPQDCVIRFKPFESSQHPIMVKLGAIATIEERHNLLKGIELWAGQIARDPELLDILTPAQDHSYTELWMQALSAPPKRERLTPLAPGATLLEGKYKILGQLGVGGQGTAYLAKNELDGTEVVLKEFILPVYVDVNVRRQALESMQKEASMLRRLDNPRVVQLLEFFVEDHRGYLSLEKIDGLSLRRIIENEGKMSEERVRDLAAQMCQMLSYLHSLTPPVVHRDFTPDNLILGKDGVLKLVDFNVAQQTESTATGTVVGKHAYLPPEQFRGRPVPQSDIYAMGATIFYLLLGHDPEPITCSHPINYRQDISAEIDQIVSHATHLDTAKRYAKIQDLAKDLGIELEEKPLTITLSSAAS